MGKFKWILVAGALLALFSGQMMAGPGSDTDTRVFFDSHVTTNASAVLMGFAANLTDMAPPSRTSMAISNTTGAPGLEGMPGGGDTVGAVWLFCYNTLVDDDGPVVEPHAAAEPVVVYTPDLTEMVGTGLDEDGMLASGRTWLVYLDEALGAVGFEGDFVGYCYVVGEFDAITGFNISDIGSGAVGLAMTSDFTGAPVEVPPVATPQ
jgi:hypothetical protein